MNNKLRQVKLFVISVVILSLMGMSTYRFTHHHDESTKVETHEDHDHQSHSDLQDDCALCLLITHFSSTTNAIYTIYLIANNGLNWSYNLFKEEFLLEEYLAQKSNKDPPYSATI